MDIAGDLAELKKNLAKMKKGKMKGLEDIDINELDWVSHGLHKRDARLYRGTLKGLSTN